MSPGAPSPETSWVRISFISIPLARRARVRQERHLAAVLDRGGDVALVLRAVAGHPTGADLAAVGDEAAEQTRVLVVHVADLLLAEHADFLLRLAELGLRHRGALLKSPAGAGMDVFGLDPRPPRAGNAGSGSGLRTAAPRNSRRRHRSRRPSHRPPHRRRHRRGSPPPDPPPP